MRNKDFWRTALNVASVIINAVLTTLFASCAVIH